MPRIESLLSARLFLQPQIIGDRIFFMSNLSGRISLYSMNTGGSIPEPLLPPDIAMQNPHLIGGVSFYVFPKLEKILVMLDKDGDENYQPMLIPLQGGYPEPAFRDQFSGDRVFCGECDQDHNIIYLRASSHTEQMNRSYQANLPSGQLVNLGESPWGSYVDGVNTSHDKVILIDGYSAGDNVLYLWTSKTKERQLLYGSPLEKRKSDKDVNLNAISSTQFAESGKSVFFVTCLFSDYKSLGYLQLDKASDIKPVNISGIRHSGVGELETVYHMKENFYLLMFNIDGCSWVYQGRFDEQALTMLLENVLVGQGQISNGVLESIFYDKMDDRFSLSFSTAMEPTQIYTIEGVDRQKIIRHTNERTLGIPAGWLCAGEDASFTSYDGTYVSARLYLPSPVLSFQGPRPVVYYIHGGPQSQERPDFAWFSMPLIQFLTLNGFAVFVPNVRGSSGYGMSYMKQVDRDWGGKDRLDHVHAMTEVLTKDKRLDVSRTGVVGRSYGGYMTLTLAGRHPDLWRAAVDMFGPYDLITFSERIPETWKPYFAVALGDPVKDRPFLVERSPRTYLDQLACPMMVIQGKNDPRVVERESRDLVENLRAQGKEIEYVMFENEGHDVLKFENRVTCYNCITDFFKKHLQP